eukprot:5110577-Amphidinium_carterae.1
MAAPVKVCNNSEHSASIERQCAEWFASVCACAVHNAQDALVVALEPGTSRRRHEKNDKPTETQLVHYGGMQKGFILNHTTRQNYNEHAIVLYTKRAKSHRRTYNKPIPCTPVRLYC